MFIMPPIPESIEALVATIESQGAVDFAMHTKENPDVIAAYRVAAQRFLENVEPYPKERFEGRGIVICGGGAKYLPSVWVTARMLRHLGCRLPIQLWHLGPDEIDDRMATLLQNLGVAVVDGLQVQRNYPCRHLWGWVLKCYAILHSPFREVLLLDADNLPLRDPTPIFDWPEFRAAGAVFWADYMHNDAEHHAWNIFGTPGRPDREFETGQVLVDKRTGWIPLQLVHHYDCHCDYYYQWVYGDKETFHHAYRHLDAPFAIPECGPEWIEGCTCQHDFAGDWIWQHRNHDKWLLDGSNRTIPRFRLEETCRQFLAELRTLRGGEPYRDPCPTAHAVAVAADIAARVIYHEAPDGSIRSIVLEPNGSAVIGSEVGSWNWAVRNLDGSLYLSILGTDGVAALLHREGNAWVGPWLEWSSASPGESTGLGAE